MGYNRSRMLWKVQAEIYSLFKKLHYNMIRIIPQLSWCRILEPYEPIRILLSAECMFAFPPSTPTCVKENKKNMY